MGYNSQQKLKDNITAILIALEWMARSIAFTWTERKWFYASQTIKIIPWNKKNNWECIILTLDQFGKIPQSPEIIREILQTELDNVEKNYIRWKIWVEKFQGVC